MRRFAYILLFLLPALAALSGYGAGPFLARASDTVQLAARVREEDARGLAQSEWTLESQAFRDTGRPKAELWRDALGVERRMSVAGALLGCWVGVVIVLKLLCLLHARRRDIYSAEAGQCVACARCFLSCPRERLRLKKLSGRITAGASSARSSAR